MKREGKKPKARRRNKSRDYKKERQEGISPNHTIETNECREGIMRKRSVRESTFCPSSKGQKRKEKTEKKAKRGRYSRGGGYHPQTNSKKRYNESELEVKKRGGGGRACCTERGEVMKSGNGKWQGLIFRGETTFPNGRRQRALDIDRGGGKARPNPKGEPEKEDRGNGRRWGGEEQEKKKFEPSRNNKRKGRGTNQLHRVRSQTRGGTKWGVKQRERAAVYR